ncbi:MAG: polymerase sigma factor [Solirubrobacterales bacterium]|nr:polymerase sigma factor [Solirubrobacterales bacterium]
MTAGRRRSELGTLGVLARSRSSPDAFADFYEQISPSVLRFFARQTRDGQTAFELLAETFSKAFEKRADFRGTTDEQAAAWLWSIARHELARCRRSRSVEMSALRRLGLERPAPSEDELRQMEWLIAIEDIRREIWAALDTLPPDQREVIKLRFVDELSNQEIAERLAVSAEVVRARASRGLRALGASEQLQAAIEMLEG